MRIDAQPKVLLAALIFWVTTTLQICAQPSPSSDLDLCKRNLRGIRDAIQNFRQAKKKLPAELAELAPKYISDFSLLVCPAEKAPRSAPGAGSPKKVSSYSYEFSLAVRPSAIFGAPEVTSRQIKQMQMGLIGSRTPMVRCFAHGADQALNLPFEGEIYLSGLYWEKRFANLIEYAELASPKGIVTYKPIVVPPRARELPPGFLDLTRFFNGSLYEPWLFKDFPFSLTNLPPGLHQWAGVSFDVRGLIQLGSKEVEPDVYPPEIKGIPINAKCHSVHFLHATSHAASNGTAIATYIMQFSDKTSLELPITYGQQLAAAASSDPIPSLAADSVLGWETDILIGPPELQKPGKLRLYHTRWKNPRPDVSIAHLELRSEMAEPGAFILAVTLE